MKINPYSDKEIAELRIEFEGMSEAEDAEIYNRFLATLDARDEKINIRESEIVDLRNQIAEGAKIARYGRPYIVKAISEAAPLVQWIDKFLARIEGEGKE